MKKSVGVFQNRGVCLQAFPRCPTPSLLLFLFCSRPNFRATRIFTRGSPRGIHSTSFARERLQRRLRPHLLHIFRNHSEISDPAFYFNIFNFESMGRVTTGKRHAILNLAHLWTEGCCSLWEEQYLILYKRLYKLYISKLGIQPICSSITIAISDDSYVMHQSFEIPDPPPPLGHRRGKSGAFTSDSLH